VNATQEISTPASTDVFTNTPFGYVEATDEINGKIYGYVIYLHENTKKGITKLKVSGSETAGTSITLGSKTAKKKIRKAIKNDKKYFLHGFKILPRNGDPSNIENRFYFSENEITKVEVGVVTRDAKNQAKSAVIKSFNLPNE